MSRSNGAVRRALAAALLLLVALAAPDAAAAQSLDGWALPSPNSNDAYTLDASDGLLVFGDGATGQSVPTGDSLAPNYSSGAGAAGNVSWSRPFVCLIVRC